MGRKLGHITNVGERGPDYGPQAQDGSGRRVTAANTDLERSIAPRETFMVADTSAGDVELTLPDIGCLLDGEGILVLRSGPDAAIVSPLAGDLINEAAGTNTIAADVDAVRYVRASAGGVRSWYRLGG